MILLRQEKKVFNYISTTEKFLNEIGRSLFEEEINDDETDLNSTQQLDSNTEKLQKLIVSLKNEFQDLYLNKNISKPMNYQKPVKVNQALNKQSQDCSLKTKEKIQKKGDDKIEIDYTDCCPKPPKGILNGKKRVVSDNLNTNKSFRELINKKILRRFISYREISNNSEFFKDIRNVEGSKINTFMSSLKKTFKIKDSLQ